jgi:drug/metabolite transporter (DMT)-like permease
MASLPPMTRQRATLLIIFCCFLWSIAGLVSRFLISKEGIEVTFWRSFFAALTVLAYLLFGNGPSAMQELRAHPRSSLVCGVMWGIMFTCFMFALSLTTVANVLITQSLGPIVTTLLTALVLRTAVPPKVWGVVFVAACGIATMYAFDVAGLEGKHWLGVGVAMGIPVAGAINLITLKRAGTAMSATTSVMLGAVFSCLVTLPFAWPLGIPTQDLLLLALLGVVQLGIPCVIVMKAAHSMQAHEVSLLILLEIVFGIMLAWAAGGERPGLATLIGGTVVLAALAYNELSSSKPKSAQ